LCCPLEDNSNEPVKSVVNNSLRQATSAATVNNSKNAASSNACNIISNNNTAASATTSTTTTTTAINMLNVSLKYVYINNSLCNLDKASTDIHDNAFFKYIISLKHLTTNCTYASYHINNITPSQASSSSSSHLTTTTTTTINHVGECLVLNQWLNAIIELLLLVNKLDNFNYCYLTNGLHNKSTECTCILNLVERKHLFKSSLIKFFLNSLDGNFFKLKHLNSFLNETALSLSSQLGIQQVETKSSWPADVCDINNKPFERSMRTLIILNEINRFLSVPCAYNVFKQAVIEKDIFVNSTVAQPDQQSQLSAGFLATADTLRTNTKLISHPINGNSNNNNNNNNNNNDENFSNMNESSKNLHIKLIANSSSNVNPTKEEEIFSEINCKN
jgi:hypothetical protein